MPIFTRIDEQDLLKGNLGSVYVRKYHPVLKLKDGEDHPPFAPGRFYKGASDRSVVEGWKARLEKYLEL